VSLLLGSLFVGGEALAAFIGVVVLTGLVEFYGTLRARGYQPLTLFGLCAGAAMLVATWFYGPVAIPAAILALVVLVFFFYALVPGRRDALTNGGLTVLGVTWVTGTAAFAYPIVDSADFRTLVMALVVATVAMDVGAYFVGRAWGSSSLAPILSPNKSIEGLAGGIVLAVVAAVLIGRFIDPFTIRIGAWLGLIVAVLAPIGDLAESMVKRSLGVKDMGSILPGHGGILDRIDALLFVLPAAWVLFSTTGLLA
jgi:phosphatidate cytidylyltransferase